MNLFYSSNPPEFRRDAWYGLIFRWYGVDKLGNVATFETGELPIPSKIFADESAYRELDLYFRQLPSITTVKVTAEMSKLKTAAGNPVNFSDAIEDACRGLYFIDEMDTFVGKDYLYGYYLVGIPERKVNFINLPDRIKTLLEPYRFPIEFSSIVEVDVAKYLDCD